MNLKKILILLIILLFLVAVFCILFYKKKYNTTQFEYKKVVSFNILNEDKSILNFINPFKESCSIFNKYKNNKIITKTPVITTAKDWQNICYKFNKSNFKDSNQLKSFIIHNFDFYLLKKNKSHVTGYYRIKLNGSLNKDNIFKYPIYKKPNDLISVNLADFSQDFKNKQIFGKIKNNRLFPYYTREEINNGALSNKNLELVWSDNQYLIFLLHVQGSGVVVLNNSKKKIYLSFASKNGHAFSGITKFLDKKAHLGTIEKIDKFFKENPNKIDNILNNNKSYIFFKEVDKNHWNAAFGTRPYAERTVAVDTNFEALGVPLLVNFNVNKSKIVRLVVANDTGSAIKGLGRIDFYWGLGEEAGNMALKTNNRNSTVYLLLPKNK